MEDFRNAYQSTAVDNTLLEDEMEVELATPWQRIGAVLINNIITALLYVPMIMGAGNSYAAYVAASEGDAIPADGGGSGLWIGVSVVLLLIWGVYQVVLMSKTGQSVGKKLMGIRVITLDGENPGFVGTVLMREVVFGLILGVISIIPVLGSIVYLGVMIALLVMIFLESRERRTLQDMLAKTLVVKA